MMHPTHDFYHALRRARRAARGGDLAAASKWTALAARHFEIVFRREELRQLRREATKAERGGPVLLDPDGCSPGGTPNWVLNQQRLERAKDGKRNPVK